MANCRLPLHVWLAWLLLATSVAHAEDMQLMLPDLNVSSRPVIEFRARRASIDPPSPGHAYILLGRELDNGLRVFNTVAGFYPDHSTGAHPFRQLVSTPGVVTQTLEDASSDITFSLYISPTQEQRVADVLAAYDDQDYSLAVRNCVTMTRDVAAAVGLRVPEGLADAVPQVFLQSLITLNTGQPAHQPPDAGLTAENVPATAAPTDNALGAAQVTLDLTKPFVPPTMTTLPNSPLQPPPEFHPPMLPPTPPPAPPPPVIPIPLS